MEDKEYIDKVNEMKDYVGSQVNLEDYVGESFLKIYPYRAIYGNEKKVLLQENTFTIVKLSQQLGKTNTDYVGYELDNKGIKYFNAFAMYDIAGKMIDSSNTTHAVKKLDMVKSFNIIGNFRIELSEHKPDFFTIGEPFNQEKYDKGEQRVYFVNGAEELSLDMSKGLIGDVDNLEDFEHLHAFSLNDVRTLTQGSRSKLNFVLTLGSMKQPQITTGYRYKDVAKPIKEHGIYFKFDNHSLLNSVKAKGILEKNPNSITDIDFKVKEPLAPFKMTPIENDLKLTMYTPWFDNNYVMNYNLYESFTTPRKFTKSIDEILIEDLLVVSAGFLDEWKHAKMKTEGGITKIDPTFRVGHQGILVSTIINQRPQNVIDKMILSFLNNNPSLRNDVSKFMKLISTIGALSKYILSDMYTFKQGGNDVNQITLPWYLELKSGILSYTNQQQITIAQPGVETTNVYSSFLPGVSYVNTKLSKLSSNTYGSITQYYKSNYGKLNNFESNSSKSAKGLVVPENFNFSNVKIIDTDRKTILPKLDESIDKVNINFIAGENDGSEKYMKYMFHLPVDLALLQTIYKNNNKITHAKDSSATVFIPRTSDGHVFHKNESAIKEYITKLLNNKYVEGNWTVDWTQVHWDYIEGFHGFINKNSVGSKPPYNYLELQDKTMLMNSEALGNAVTNECKGVSGWLGYGGYGVSQVCKMEQTAVRKALVNVLNIDDESIKEWVLPDGGATWWWINTYDTNNSAQIDGFDSHLDYSIEHISFNPISITFLKDVTLGQGGESDVNEIDKRQVTFDKSDWQKFIYSYLDTTDNRTTLHLIEKDGSPIKEISEIEISSLWGDYIEVYCDGMKPIKIELNNREDETIGVERITFF